MTAVDAEAALDRIDRKILRILQAEGRLTNQALAERVALSPSACLARIRHLERTGVIQGYHARIDPFALGVGLVLYVEVSLAGSRSDETARFEGAMAALPQVVAELKEERRQELEPAPWLRRRTQARDQCRWL